MAALCVTVTATSAGTALADTSDNGPAKPSNVRITVLPDLPALPADALKAAAPLAPVAETSRTTRPEPAMLAAMQRDLGISADQVEARIAADERAGVLMPLLRQKLGTAFGGLWIEPDSSGGFAVGVTDPAQADKVLAVGGKPRSVRRSEQQLIDLVAKLDQHGERAPDGIVSWAVDLPTNSVVVQTLPDAVATVAGFLTASGVDAAAVRTETTTARPEPLYDVRGGDNYGGCSIGFAVVGGYVTAGHCTTAGTQVNGYNGVMAGVVRGSNRRTRDMGWVQTNMLWTPQPLVNDYNGGVVQVTGARPAPVGSALCRSGRTSGWHCGVITARGVTYSFPDGNVWPGQVVSTACADGGDSGGPGLSGTQGQGTLSTGYRCDSGLHSTSYQPLEETLSTYGLTLVTGAPAPVALAGDWNGDGKDTAAVYKPANRSFYLRNSNNSGDADITVNYGAPGDVPVAGDWDGDGTDTIGVYRPSSSTFYLRTTNNPADTTTVEVDLDRDNHLPIVGDWDGDGIDDIGVYSIGDHKYTLWVMEAGTAFYYVDLNLGQVGDVPLTGDWDTNTIDSIAAFRPTNNTFYRRYNNNLGEVGTHTPLAFGRMRDLPVSGDWNGDGTDTVGVYRMENHTFYLYNESGPATEFRYG